MKSLILIIAILILFTSCQQSKVSKQNISINIENKQGDDCINSVFYTCICSYIKTSGMYFSTGWTTFINLYLFKKDMADYLTIWADSLSPLYRYLGGNTKGLDVFHLKINLATCNISPNLKLLNIDSCYVVIMKPTDYDTDIYNACLDILRTDDCIEDNGMINDGRLFIQTYKYSKTADSVHVEKLDKPIIDFFEELPDKFW